MSWTAAAFVFLSLFLGLNHGGGTGPTNEQPPAIETSSPPYRPSDFFTSNPLDTLVMSGPDEINTIFGMEFIDEVRTIKNDCEWKEYLVEVDLQQERKELLNYAENIDELKDKKYFKDLPPEEQNQVQDSAQVAIDNLVQKEKDQEDKLAKQCNNALMKLEDERMRDALNFAKAKLMKGTGAFARYVNRVADYGLMVEDALGECLNVYANELLSRDYMVRMSPSEICMEVEVEVLVRFINEFVVRASQLVITYADDEDLDSLTSGSGSFERVPPRIPESFPRPYTPLDQLPKKPETMEETENAELDTDDEEEGQNDGQFDSEFGNPDENHEPIPSPVSNDEQVDSDFGNPDENYEPIPSPVSHDEQFDSDFGNPGENHETIPSPVSNDEQFDSDFGNPDENHGPIPSPVSHEYTEQIDEELLSAISSYEAKDKPRPTNLPSHKSSTLTPRPSPVVGGGTDRSGSKDSGLSQQDNEFTKLEQPGRPFRPTRPDGGRGGGRPGAVARPAASAKPKRPIPYQRPARPQDGTNQRPIRPLLRPPHPDGKGMLVSRPSSSVVVAEQNTLSAIPSNAPTPSAETSASSEEHSRSTIVVMIVFGTAAVILVLAIIVLAVFIGITKYRTARKGWTKLTEHEKVDLMKRSGYVNPTYQFFDRVTQ